MDAGGGWERGDPHAQEGAATGCQSRGLRCLSEHRRGREVQAKKIDLMDDPTYAEAWNRQQALQLELATLEGDIEAVNEALNLEGQSPLIGLDVLREGGSSTGYNNHFLAGVEIKVIGPAKLVVAGDSVLIREGSGSEEDSDEGSGEQGFMIVIGPSSESTIVEFVVPENYGEWEFASFATDGQSYEDGMRGTIKVFPCLASSKSADAGSSRRGGC